MNKRLSGMPHLGSDVYAPVMPKWFANLLRLISFCFAVFTAWLGVRDWQSMPLFAQVIVVVLPPVMLFAALDPRGWASLANTPFFMADSKGLYFKHSMASVVHLGKDAALKNAQRVSWLFVPWKHVSNIRVDAVRVHGRSSKGAVLDIKASDEELKDFFVYWKPLASGDASVAFYTNIPPTPRDVVARVQEMMKRYKKSSLAVKYAREK